jgi:hypothetical protein
MRRFGLLQLVLLLLIVFQLNDWSRLDGSSVQSSKQIAPSHDPVFPNGIKARATLWRHIEFAGAVSNGLCLTNLQNESARAQTRTPLESRLGVSSKLDPVTELMSQQC